MNDIKYIEIQFLVKVNKPKIKITLVNLMSRDDALFIADQVKLDKSVFSVTCWTEKNTFI